MHLHLRAWVKLLDAGYQHHTELYRARAREWIRRNFGAASIHRKDKAFPPASPSVWQVLAGSMVNSPRSSPFVVDDSHVAVGDEEHDPGAAVAAPDAQEWSSMTLRAGDRVGGRCPSVHGTAFARHDLGVFLAGLRFEGRKVVATLVGTSAGHGDDQGQGKEATCPGATPTQARCPWATETLRDRCGFSRGYSAHLPVPLSLYWCPKSQIPSLVTPSWSSRDTVGWSRSRGVTAG